MTAVIVFGNEKGGAGKSTLAVHVAVAMARLGLAVWAITAIPAKAVSAIISPSGRYFLRPMYHALTEPSLY